MNERQFSKLTNRIGRAVHSQNKHFLLRQCYCAFENIPDCKAADIMLVKPQVTEPDIIDFRVISVRHPNFEKELAKSVVVEGFLPIGLLYDNPRKATLWPFVVPRLYVRDFIKWARGEAITIANYLDGKLSTDLAWEVGKPEDLPPSAGQA